MDRLGAEEVLKDADPRSLERILIKVSGIILVDVPNVPGRIRIR